jgi:hypothetical protein
MGSFSVIMVVGVITMRKIASVLLFSLLPVLFCNAQAKELNFRQYGKATQEMKDIGLCAAHSTIPIGSKATIISQSTNKSVEVTVIKRLKPSPDRVIDLSPAAAKAIDMGSSGQVIVETNELSHPVVPSGADRGRGYTVSSGPYDNGRIRLMLYKDTGRFALYYLMDDGQALPFFMSQDPRTSYITVFLNNREYRIGDASLFRINLGGTPINPAIIFESSFLTVVQDFTFIKTASSSVTNGIKINVTITNKTGQPVEAGMRYLIDTTLGEKDPAHFFTDQRQVASETIIEKMFADKYWVSRNANLALVGTIIGQNATRPDIVQFANWKRLYDTPWKLPYVAGRNFNLVPASIGDSAVSLYYEPIPVNPGGLRTISIILASEDESGQVRSSGGSGPAPAVFAGKAAEDSTLDNKMAQLIQEDLASLKKLLALLDEYESSGNVSDEDLLAIETNIFRIKERYGVP